MITLCVCSAISLVIAAYASDMEQKTKIELNKKTKQNPVNK